MDQDERVIQAEIEKCVSELRAHLEAIEISAAFAENDRLQLIQIIDAIETQLRTIPDA